MMTFYLSSKMKSSKSLYQFTIFLSGQAGRFFERNLQEVRELSQQVDNPAED
jgi:hypothetical protein